MATFRIPIMGFGTKPDTSGDVFFEPESVKYSNALNDVLLGVFNDTATRIGLALKFKVPVNYVDNPKLIITWSSTATSGDVEWDYDYTSIAIGETLDPAAAQRSINQNDTAPGSSLFMLEAELAMTNTDLAAKDLCKGVLFRDGTDAGDTMTASAIIETIEFEYTDA